MARNVIHEFAQAYDPAEHGHNPATFWASVRIIEEHERQTADPSEREMYEGQAADRARELGTLVSSHNYAIRESDRYLARPKEAPKWWREWYQGQDSGSNAHESDELRKLAEVPANIARAANHYHPDQRIAAYRKELRTIAPLSLWIVGEEQATLAASWLADVANALFVDVPLLIAQMEGSNRYGEGGSQSTANRLMAPSLLILDRPDLATWNAPTVAALLPVMRSRRNKGLPSVYTSAVNHDAFGSQRLMAQARNDEQRRNATELCRTIKATLGRNEADRVAHEITLQM